MGKIRYTIVLTVELRKKSQMTNSGGAHATEFITLLCGDGGYDKLIHRSHSEFYTERTRVKLKGAG